MHLERDRLVACVRKRLSVILFVYTMCIYVYGVCTHRYAYSTFASEFHNKKEK